MLKKMGTCLMFFLLMALFLSGCTASDEKITVSLDWAPNTNHTGLYAAVDQGYYKEEGLDVEIIQPPEGTAESLVAAGQAQFGVGYQESVTFARLEDMPVVSIASVIQHNTSGFASLKKKGIETPADFEGKRYGGWGSPVEKATLKALMEKYDADVERVEIITSGDMDFFAASEKDIDFAWIFEGWTGIEARIRGIELNYIDLGQENEALDYYTPVIITNEKIINNNPDLVRAFMKATAKGYEYSMENPEAAAEILLKNAPELDRTLVFESQKYLSGQYQAEAEQWGLQKEEVWQNYTDWLFKNGLISKKIDVKAAFTNEFLPER